MDFIASFILLTPVIIAFFGVLKKKRFYFLLGYTLYSFLVVPVELNSFVLSGKFIHLMVAALWFAQFIIAFPNSINYDGSKVFKLFDVKVFLSLMVINIIGVFVVLNNPMINNICVYYHAILATLPIVATYLLFANKIPIQDND